MIRPFRERNAAFLTSLAALGANTQDEPEMDDSIPDDRLKLMFTCCHPALALDAISLCRLLVAPQPVAMLPQSAEAAACWR